MIRGCAEAEVQPYLIKYKQVHTNSGGCRRVCNKMMDQMGLRRLPRGRAARSCCWGAMACMPYTLHPPPRHSSSVWRHSVMAIINRSFLVSNCFFRFILILISKLVEDWSGRTRLCWPGPNAAEVLTHGFVADAVLVRPFPSFKRMIFPQLPWPSGVQLPKNSSAVGARVLE